MAKMLDGPVPNGARSVSWPWYHHVLTNELTPDARKLLAAYSGISPAKMEAHIYRIVSLSFLGLSKSATDLRPSETKLGASFHGRASASSGS